MKKLESSDMPVILVKDVPPARTCQWPYGEPGKKNFHFCGKKSHEGFSYCPEHVAMAYRPSEPRRRVA
jgi:hypothetical protein